MKTVAIKDIVIGERSRKNLGDIDALAEALKDSPDLVKREAYDTQRRLLEEEWQTEGHEAIQIRDDGRMFFSSHFFFHDYNPQLVAVQSPGKYGVLFFDCEARARRRAQEERRAAYKPPAIERELELQIVAKIIAGGGTAQRQVKTIFGTIDIHVLTPHESIIEVKAFADQKSLRMAIGQLAFYALSYPGAALYVATPEAIAVDFLPALRGMGVQEWTL